MPLKTLSIIMIIIGILTIIFTILHIYKNRTSRDLPGGVVFTEIIMPLIIGVIATGVGGYIFANNNADWNKDITAIDEKIMMENGCDDLNDYYVRVVETDEKLSTGYISTYLQRIDTTDEVRPEDYKYRYIEIINKIKETAPPIVTYSMSELAEKSTNKVQADVLKLKNVEDGYSEEFVFFSKNDSGTAKYYLYENLEIYENKVENLQHVYGDVYVLDHMLENVEDKSDSLVLKLCSKNKIPDGDVGYGFIRRYIGKVNDYNGDGGRMLCYEQVDKDQSDKDQSDVIPFLTYETSPEAFGENGVSGSEIVLMETPSFNEDHKVIIPMQSVHLHPDMETCSILRGYFIRY